MQLPEDFLYEAQKILDLRVDITTRFLYSTDASIYQIEPLGVAFPRDGDQLAGVVELASKYHVPVLARGAGSSLAGQAIGEALILDCSRYMDHIIDINPEERTATVEAGVVLNAFNKALQKHALQFGPDPASAERATMGGSLANNASGAHSILYGMAADHLLAAEVVLSDGSVTQFEEMPAEEALRIATTYKQNNHNEETTNRVGAIYASALQIRERYQDIIRQKWPRTWRNASGYGLHYLLPWSPSAPPQWGRADNFTSQCSLPYPPVSPGSFNLSPLLCGSEGTLAIIRKAKLRLVSRPRNTILGVIPYEGLAEACDAVPGILELNPSAIELIPRNLIFLARSLPAYARQLSFMDEFSKNGEIPPALLVIEFSGEAPSELIEKTRRLGNHVFIAESAEVQKQIWEVRKVGLGILMSRPGDTKPVAFIEDLSVPVESLGKFVREMQRILSENHTEGDFYAHASAGCLHIRPLVNLKTAGGVKTLRNIARQSIEVVLQSGGSASGEHSDGLARGEWLTKVYGKEICTAFQELKQAADPDNILNPGKKVNVQPMDTNLRYGVHYHARGWEPVMDFSRPGGSPGINGLLEAIEQCNGAGVCRKAEGVMCPSFRATQDEMHNTRGRANLLRAMISGRFPGDKLAESSVREALDLCLACKGCKAECPSGVDMAKLKYEFTYQYYLKHPRKLRDYLFGYISAFSRVGSFFPSMTNALFGSRLFSFIGDRVLGLSSQRALPRFAPQSLSKILHNKRIIKPGGTVHSTEKVLLLIDAFTEYYYPQAGLAAVKTLCAAGCEVQVLPFLGAGRTLISKGFLKAAKTYTMSLVKSINRLDPDRKMAVIGVEPSEIYTLRDEYPDLLPGDESVLALAQRSWMIDEFIIRPSLNHQIRLNKILEKNNKILESPKTTVLVHGHCYQKAQPPAADGYPVGAFATIEMLKALGYEVKLIDSGCCGMAGAFGYESEHYELSVRVGELGLLKEVRKAEASVIIAASGVSCQAQILDGTGRQAIHPIQLVNPSE